MVSNSIKHHVKHPYVSASMCVFVSAVHVHVFLYVCPAFVEVYKYVLL